MPDTTKLNSQLALLRNGSPEAREILIEHACERLRRLTRKMLRGFPSVHRWSETDDVLQAALMRLHRALESVHPQTHVEFFGLGAIQIRRELLDLAKHFHGPEGIGANHLTDTGSIVVGKQEPHVEPSTLEGWSRFHEAVEGLPDDQRQVVDLVWYEGLSQPESAAALNVSLATLKRRWAAARLTLCEVLEDWTVE